MSKEQSTQEEIKVVDQPEVETAASKPIAGVSAGSKPVASTGAESPRTARDPDFDDDEPEAQLAIPESQPVPQKKRVSFQDEHLPAPAPPPKPPRPMSPNAQAQATLIEAFPAIDVKVIRAVLTASGGRVEPAFNALLGMSDPDFQEPTPPRPPRKSSATAVSQLEADAIYARQLAQHYDNQQSIGDGFGSRGRGEPPLPRRKQTNLKPNELYDDRDHSFIDDDLPVIKQNLQKGFEDTKKTINSWITDFTKKLNGEEDDPIPQSGPSRQERYDFGPSTHEQLYGIQRNAEARKRTEAQTRAYDADPQLLSDDFGHRLELRDDEQPPARPPRPAANPNLFKSGADSALFGQETSVAPAGIRASPAVNRQASPANAGGAAKSGKWQPLSSIEPRAELEDRDPFSLGDSDEELDTKKEPKSPMKESSRRTIELTDQTTSDTGATEQMSVKTDATKDK